MGNASSARWLRVGLILLVGLSVLFPFFSVHRLEYEHDTTGDVNGLLGVEKNAPKSQSLNTGASSSSQRQPADAVDQSSIISPIINATSNVCLSPVCIAQTAARLARAYPDKTNRSAWIITPQDDYNPQDQGYECAGIIYVKNFKAASSTAAGIALRIAYQHGGERKKDHAWVKFSHVRGFKYAGRDPARSVLFTSLRDPAARAISRIFYTSITQKGERPTDENLLQKLRWNHRQYGAVSHEGGGYQVRYVSMIKELNTSWAPEEPNYVVDPQQIERNVREIIHAYDFIMVAERMDESIVVLALILGLDLSDVLVMDAKQNMGKEYLYFSNHDHKSQKLVETCRLSVRAFCSAAVQSHLESMEWFSKNYGDYLLHAAALQSLDLTIERLGRPRFQKALQEYRQLKLMAKERCSNETVGHCSAEGMVQRDLSSLNCYSDDSGCGYPCIDQMLAEQAKNNL